METCSVVLTSESVDEILWCDHSYETSSAVLLHGTISDLFSSILQYFTFLMLALLRMKGLQYLFLVCSVPLH